MNEKKGFDFKAWFSANGGLVRGLVLVAVVVLTLFTNVRVSDVANDVDETLDGPLVAYLPEDVQTALDNLQAEWDGLAPTVSSLEEILSVLDEVEAQGVTNFDRLDLSAGSTGAILSVNQSSTGNIAQFQDGGTTVWSVADGGAVTQTGAGTVTGNYTVNGNLVVTGTSDLQGNVSDSAGVWTLADNGIVDGQADAVQLTVQGYTTNTNYLFVVEQSDGTDVWRTNVSGQSSSANGAVSFVDDVIVDGAEDTDQLTVQGYTTQTNDLQVWEQSDGTDVATMSNAGLLDISGELNFGSNDLSVIGYASTGQQLIYGSALVTGTLAAPHGLTTVTFCLCTLGEDPTAGAGDGAMCTVTVAANVCTLKVWQDDFVTAATETDVDVHWVVVGAP